MDQLEFRQFNQRQFSNLLKSGDGTMLKALYLRYYKNIEHYVEKNSGSPDDAKDIYQEAFTAVWRNVQLDRFVPNDEGEFAAYLTRVAKNKWIDELRKNKNKHQVSMGGEHELSMVSEMEADQTDAYIDTVKRQYKHLGERCRELLSRFYFHKQSLRKIAAIFDWTEASAKNNKYRCLKQLRELVLKGVNNG
ncbi:RNA polymerase sigma factor [Parapedobacter pyrenivorans]|uniref:RNA polymerase sigma factor n=1 Tax=Parapedobacter pyrenivorans TaxID=1305674 RepID=UPI00334085E5